MSDEEPIFHTDGFTNPGWRKKLSADYSPLPIENEDRGLRLEEAISRFATDLEAQEIYNRFRYEGRVSSSCLNKFVQSEYYLVRDLIHGLLKGNLKARGFIQGSLRPEAIPQEWWSEVAVDLRLNAARAHGTKVSGLRITKELDAEASTSEHKSPASRAEVDTWMMTHFQAAAARGEPRPKKASAIEDCLEYFGDRVTANSAAHAYSLVPPSLKNARGAPKKKR